MRINNLVKNHCLAKSINDTGWYQFRKWLEYFGVKFGKVTVAVNPAYTSQECSSCGTVVKKSLSMRTHVCQCGFVLDRDNNAAINILKLALSTTGHVGTWVKDPNALPRFAHHARLTPRFANANGRFDLYFDWSNPVTASWLYERRILVPLGRGVSKHPQTAAVCFSSFCSLRYSMA